MDTSTGSQEAEQGKQEFDMTDSVQAGETWHVHTWNDGQWSVWTEGEVRVAIVDTREHADRIIADHERATWAAKKLEYLLSEWVAPDHRKLAEADLLARYQQQEGNS